MSFLCCCKTVSKLDSFVRDDADEDEDDDEDDDGFKDSSSWSFLKLGQSIFNRFLNFQNRI